MVRLENFTVSGPADLGKGAMLQVDFYITNFGQKALNLTDKGVFAGVLGPGWSEEEFGAVNAGEMFETEQIIHFSRQFAIPEKGVWDIWPSYEFWKKSYSAVLDANVTVRVKGPLYWQACEITACPEEYCEEGMHYTLEYAGQDRDCVYEEGECGARGLLRKERISESSSG